MLQTPIKKTMDSATEEGNHSEETTSPSPAAKMNLNREVNFYRSGKTSATRIVELFSKAASALPSVCASTGSDWEAAVVEILRLPEVEEFLLHISRVRVFNTKLHAGLRHNLELLSEIKKLKYWYVTQMSAFLLSLSFASKAVGVVCSDLEAHALAALACEAGRARVRTVCRKHAGMERYLQNEAELETSEPHAVYPTSTYRSCDGHVVATEDASLIESVMSTTLTTTIKIQSNLLSLTNQTLRNVYGPLGRCTCVIDRRVDELHGGRLSAYFAHYGIDLAKMAFSGNEADKGIESVELILWSLKKRGVSRNEPVLIVGGGVIADLAGFATALYHRNTPYVMLCTSIVAGIDAGPSPRTCCDGDGYKNLFGSYHPPVLTLTDRTLFQTLREGWLRHGIAEIIKMAVVKDFALFELLEQAGPRLTYSKFGTLCEDDEEFISTVDLIVGKAMHSYVQSEYGNLWETHQCRPHAYGHTWSPGYEIPAGMLHGHAVATGMGWGAYVAKYKGFINQQQLDRICKLISDMELSLWHPIMEDAQLIWNTQLKITEKRGGHLCAPVPKGEIGQCGYIQDLPLDEIKECLVGYKEMCDRYPRSGLGLEVHCKDVGLEDPSTVANRSDSAVIAELKDENAKLKAQIAKFMGVSGCGDGTCC